MPNPPLRSPEPPPRKMVGELLTANQADGYYTELVNRDDSAYEKVYPVKRGTPYAALYNANSRIIAQYASQGGLFFCKEIRPGQSSDVGTTSKWVVWVWATIFLAENVENATIDYLGDSITNQVFSRSYTIRRDTYEATPSIALGTPLTALLGVQITAGGTGYTFATGTFGVAGTGAEVTFVIEAGVIRSAVVTKEGTGFTAASTVTIGGDGTGATATVIIQPVAAILTSQKKQEFPDDSPFSHEFVNALRVYEVLPGPWLPFTRWDDQFGSIQGRRRAVVYTGQVSSQTLTTRTNYESRDGSYYVAWQIEETNTDGSGSSASEPAFPVLMGYDIDQESNIGVFTAATPVPNGTSGGINLPSSKTITAATVAANTVVTLDDVDGLVAGIQMLFAGNSNCTPDLDGYHRILALDVPNKKVTLDFAVTANASGGAGGTAILSAPVYREIVRTKSNLSIQISSQVDVTSLPFATKTWDTYIDYAFPDSLLGLDVYQDTASSDSVPDGTLPLSYSITFSSGYQVSGTVAVRIKDGYRGKVFAVVTRTYSIGAPPVVESVQKIRLSSGTVVITGGSQQDSLSIIGHSLGTYTVTSTSSSRRYDTVSLNNLLTGDFTSSNLASGSFSSGSGSATIDLKLDASSPTTFDAGDDFIYDVKVSDGRLGLYVKDVIEIVVPIPFP